MLWRKTMIQSLKSSQVLLLKGSNKQVMGTFMGHDIHAWFASPFTKSFWIQFCIFMRYLKIFMTNLISGANRVNVG